MKLNTFQLFNADKAKLKKKDGNRERERNAFSICANYCGGHIHPHRYTRIQLQITPTQRRCLHAKVSFFIACVCVWRSGAKGNWQLATGEWPEKTSQNQRKTVEKIRIEFAKPQ